MPKKVTESVVTNEPSQFSQPFLRDLFARAQNAANNVNTAPFGGDLFAGPTDAQLLGQNIKIDRALRSDAGAGSAFALNKTADLLGGDFFGSVARSGFVPGQRSIDGQFDPGEFNFRETNLSPAFSLGGPGQTLGAVQDFTAGFNPNGAGGDLQSAIDAAVAPIQRNFQETLLPGLERNLTGSGAFDNSRAQFSVEKLIEQGFSRPANEVAQGLVFQDAQRRAQDENANFRLLSQLGASSQENFAQRQLQDLLSLRGQTLQQGLAENQLDFQDLQQKRQLTLDDIFSIRGQQGQDFRLQEGLRQGDLAQQRGLIPSLLQEQSRLLGLIPGLEQSAFSLGQAPGQVLSQVGAEQQRFNQGFIDEALQLFQLQNQIPFAGLAQLSNIIQGQPFNTTSSTQSTPGASGVSQGIQGALGGAALGAKLGSVVPGIGTAVGGIGGGLLGLLGGIL